MGTTIFSSQLFAQEVTEENKKLAQTYMELGDETLEGSKALDQASDMYKLAAETDPTNVQANYKAGDAIIRTINKDRAAKYFERVFTSDPDFRFDILYKTGRSYQYGMDFDQALDYYNRYRDRLLAESGYRGKE